MKERMKLEILNSIDNWKGQKKSFKNEDDCFKKSKQMHSHLLSRLHSCISECPNSHHIELYNDK